MTTQIDDRDLGMKRLLEEMREAGAHHVRVGIMGKEAGEAKVYFDAHGGQGRSVTATLVEVASVHEFGSPAHGIPERSFLRSAIDTNRTKLTARSADLLGLITDGKLGAKRALGLLGQEIEACVDDQFEAGGDPRWDPVQHRDGTPLSDTGQLKNSITSRVVRDSNENV